MQFADKTTLGQSAVLGLLCVFPSPPSPFTSSGLTRVRTRRRNGPTHYITKDQFNWLGTVFYLFFLGFEWPQNLALQYLPVGKWMRFVLV